MSLLCKNVYILLTNKQMVASKEYKQDKKWWLRIHTSAALELLKHYTVVIHNMSIHISYWTIPIFIQFSSFYSFKFSVSVCMCDRTDILLHTLLSVL